MDPAQASDGLSSLGVYVLGVLALVVLTVVLVAGYVVAVRRERRYAAMALVGAITFGLVAVLGILLYPYIDPATGLTAADAAVSVLPLNLMTVATAILLPLVLVYFGVLYSSFRGPLAAEETY